MALNPGTNTTMDGRITSPTTAYPYGSAKDETTPDAADGTPYFKARADDVFGFQQALLREASIVPTGNPDTAITSQYLTALKSIITSGTLIWARTGNTDQIPLNKLGNVPTDKTDIWAQINNTDPVPLAKLSLAPGPNAVYWAQTSNADLIPADKLSLAPQGGGAPPWDWATLNNAKAIPASKLANAPQIAVVSWAYNSSSAQIPRNRLTNAPKTSVVSWATGSSTAQIPANRLQNAPQTPSAAPWDWATLNNAKLIPSNKLLNAPQVAVVSWALNSSSAQIPGNRLSNAPNNSRGDTRYLGTATKSKSAEQTVSFSGGGNPRFGVSNTTSDGAFQQTVLSVRKSGSNMITISRNTNLNNTNSKTYYIYGAA